jgi:hypothetical protein
MKKLLTGDELIDFAKKITSKEEFDFFLQCLVKDYVDNQSEWENADLLNYLTGLSKYVVDMKGFYQNIGEDIDTGIITWRIAAEMLIAASVYGN